MASATEHDAEKWTPLLGQTSCSDIGIRSRSGVLIGSIKTPRDLGEETADGRDPGCAETGHARRQVRPVHGPRVPDRHAGDHPPAPHAARARPPGRPQHGRLRVGLPRLADRRPRPESLARQGLSRPRQHRLPARPQRRARRHRRVGLAAGRDARRGQIRRRLRRLVRQGAGRRPLRRRLPPRQHGRLLETRRRARLHGRRPHRRSRPPWRTSRNSTSST